MAAFSDSITLVSLELFDAAFAVAPGDEDDVKRRFMTLFAHDTGLRRGGSAEVCLATNTQGERFALKRLHTPAAQPVAPPAAAPPGAAPGPARKELRHSVGSSGTPGSSPTPDYVTEGHVAAFYEEYRIHLALSSLRGFPRLYGFGLAGGLPVILMEWVEGTTLREAVRARMREVATPLPLSSVAKLGLAVLELLRRAGELSERFLHRDLSPRNIMLRTDRTPAAKQLESGSFDLCLIDFGSASLTAEAGTDPTFTARAGVWRLGTPAYAPPEMLGAEAQTPAARQSATIDVYALCSVLFELYGGTVPFDARAADGRGMQRVKREDAPRPLVLREPDAGTLARAICAGLSPDPAERPQPAELAAALQNWLALPGQPPKGSLRATSPAERGFWNEEHARRLVSRRRFVSGCIVGAAALAGGALILAHAGKSRETTLDEDRYERAEGPYGGEALFRACDARRGWMLCTAEGDIVCRPASSRPCGALREGLVALFDDLSGRYGYVVPSGTADGYAWAILPRFGVAGDFSEGRAAARDAKSGLWGYVDTAGSWSLQPQFADVAPFSQGVAAASPEGGGGLWGALREDGSWEIEPRYLALGRRAEDGCAVAQDTDGGWGIVDDTGSWTSGTRFAQLRRHAYGLAPALDATCGLWGYVDAGGTWAIEPAFLDARPLCRASTGEGDPLAAVKDARTQLWHFMGPDGSAPTSPSLWRLGDLCDGLAPAQARADDDVVFFSADDPDARAEGVGMRYGYVDARGSWQMRRLTELTDTGINPAGI